MAVDEEPLAPTTPEVPSGPEPPRKKRHVTSGILILMILTVAGVVAPFIANLFAHHAGGLDSTKVFPVTIRNDTSAPLVAQLCGSGCLPDVQKVSIPGGASAQVNVSSAGTVTRYYLLEPSGHLVGCLPLRFSKEVSGFSVAASQAEACPGSPIGAP